MTGPSAPPVVSRETEDRFDRYLALLAKWQGAINLVGPDTLKDARARHIEDSLQLLPYLPSGPAVLFDLGSGAGFPGLVLAMARPDVSVYLIESDQKKCSFLRTVSRETETPAQIICTRVEQAHDGEDPLPLPDVITARALAPLIVLFDYCRDWAVSQPSLVLLFLKGAQADTEIEEARKSYDFALRVTPAVGGGQILRVTGLSPKAPQKA